MYVQQSRRDAYIRICYPLKIDRGCLHGEVIENGRTRNCLTLSSNDLCSVPVLVLVHVWVHIPGDPQSVQLMNATTTIRIFASVFHFQLVSSD